MAHPRFGDIAACVFDAYGTLFDYNAAAGRHVAALGDKAAPLAELWRHKQLQYTWLRSLMGRYTGFWQVTGDALDFSMGELGIEDDALRARLMEGLPHPGRLPGGAGDAGDAQGARAQDRHPLERRARDAEGGGRGGRNR